MLEEITVLELSHPYTMNAGRILADLGANVIVVEPVGGSKGRRQGPFGPGPANLGNSLVWHTLNRGKKSVTLNLDDPDGRALFDELAEKADAVIEALDTGNASARILEQDRPTDLVHCVISPFFRDSRKADYTSTDAVVVAAGGAPSTNGLRGDPPLFFPIPQAMMEAGGDAAIATLGALLAVERGGAQRVDVTARASCTLSAFDRVLRSPGQVGRSRPLAAGLAIAGAPVMPSSFECVDGTVSITLPMVPSFRDMIKRVGRWIVESGELDANWVDHDWVAEARAISSEKRDTKTLDSFIEGVRRICQRLTWREVVLQSREYGFMVAPLLTMEDIAGFEQFKASGLFETSMINGIEVEMPSGVFHLTNHKTETVNHAPALGEHNAEILGTALRLSRHEIDALFAKGAI